MTNTAQNYDNVVSIQDLAPPAKKSRRAAITDDNVVTKLVKKNPHRAGTTNYAEWSKIRSGSKFADLRRKVITSYIRYAEDRGLLAVS